MFAIDVPHLGVELGGGALLGGLTGYATKKIAKVVVALVGLQIALFAFLESQGVLTVEWSKLTSGIVLTTGNAASGAPPAWLTSILTMLPVSGGFAGGFVLGFRRG